MIATNIDTFECIKRRENVEQREQSSDAMTSSSPHVKPDSDIPNEFKKWVRELNTLQKASNRKEEAITNSDPSFLIASKLVRNGITVLTPVEEALEIMTNKQNAGDTMELTIVMQKLPQQWSLYRIVLQHNAKDYFRKHLTETTDFMQRRMQLLRS